MGSNKEVSQKGTLFSFFRQSAVEAGPGPSTSGATAVALMSETNEVCYIIFKKDFDKKVH